MPARRGFPPATVARIDAGKILGIRAGSEPHRFIGIWAVVVRGRVFVRSWSVKPRSWFRTFQADPRGTINVAGREIAVRAARVRSEPLLDAIDRAYLDKYHTPGSVKYARDLGSPKSRATTTELLPVSPTPVGRKKRNQPAKSAAGPARRQPVHPRRNA